MPIIIRRTQTPHCQRHPREIAFCMRVCVCVWGCLPRGPHRSPLWSSLGRGVSFMELIRESCSVYKRSLDPYGHPPQASDDLTSPQVQKQQADRRHCSTKSNRTFRTLCFLGYASSIHPVDKVIPYPARGRVWLSLTCILGTTKPAR